MLKTLISEPRFSYHLIKIHGEKSLKNTTQKSFHLVTVATSCLKMKHLSLQKPLAAFDLNPFFHGRLPRTTEWVRLEVALKGGPTALLRPSAGCSWSCPV